MQKNKVNFKKILKITFNSIFYALLVFMVLFSFANMKLKASDDVANLFGRGFVTVLTGSMDGNEDDSFSVDDLVFVKTLDNNQSRASLEEGNIVTFYDPAIQGLITHRIVDVVDLDGKVFYQTKGDANASADENLLNHENVIAVYTGQIKNIGKAIKTVQTPNGFLLYLIIPSAIFMIFEGVILAKNVMAISKNKLETKFAQEKEDAERRMEEEKEKMRQQILEELKKESKSE